MKVETVSINKIKPYENNPRNNDDAVDAVANHSWSYTVQGC